MRQRTSKTLIVLFGIIGSMFLLVHALAIYNNFNSVALTLWIIEFFIGACSLFYWRTLFLGEPLVNELNETKEGYRATTLNENLVDILIPTIDEKYEVLSRTIEASLKLDNRNEVYILDDGNREWLKQLCQEKEISYLTRPTNEHAKAGNLNYALQRIKSPYVLILDADMIPAPDILKAAMPHFEDNSVGIVQFPQEFYNLDSFQHWKFNEEWTDLTFGLRKVNPSRNYFKASYWCGSPSIVRTSALQSVGGVKTTSVTEDLQTTTGLMAEGYWVKSLTIIKAKGIAPSDFYSYCIQRQRWSKGFFQLWWSAENPLKQNLPLTIKIEWFGDLFYHIHMSFYFLIVQLFPLWAILAGGPLFPNYSGFLIPIWALLLFALYGLNVRLAGKYYRIIPIQVFMRLAMFPIILGFFESLHRKNFKFEVTPKDNDQRMSKRTSIFSLLILMILFANLIPIFYLIETEVYHLEHVFIGLWSITNVYLIGLALLKLKRHWNYESHDWRTESLFL